MKTDKAWNFILFYFFAFTGKEVLRIRYFTIVWAFFSFDFCRNSLIFQNILSLQVVYLGNFLVLNYSLEQSEGCIFKTAISHDWVDAWN